MTSNPGPAQAPLIHARGLTKRFGSFTAVDAIDFDVAPGESFGFLGPNGAGKTSTMRMIGCVSPVTEGDAADPGPGPGAATGRGSAAASAWCPQQDTLDTELSVLDNLVIYGRYFGLSRAEARRRATELLEFAQLTRARERQGGPALGRHEAPPDDRPRADQRAVDPAARRAHHRPRPAGPPPALGAPLPAQAARRDARPHDALHGRGRAAVRPPRGHGQGEDRRRGIAARAHRAATPPARSPSCASRSASRRRWASSSTGIGDRVEPPAGPRPRLLRRRRGGRGRRPRSAACGPRRSSSAGARSRTCSCG